MRRLSTWLFCSAIVFLVAISTSWGQLPPPPRQPPPVYFIFFCVNADLSGLEDMYVPIHVPAHAVITINFALNQCRLTAAQGTIVFSTSDPATTPPLVTYGPSDVT